MTKKLPSGELNSSPEISIEYFPPKGLSAERSLITSAHALKRFNPSYQTITYGAGGSATEGSLEWAVQLQNFTDIPTACHIALCHFTPETLADYADELWDSDIKRLVVLRGDAAQDGGLSGFESVADAVRQLKKQHGFDISVAAYPEVHPKAPSEIHDLDVLMEKLDAGADRALTQYFFNNEDFYRFRDRAEARGFNKPIVPGIIPIANFERIKSFSENCGATIPDHFGPLFAAAGDDKGEHTKVARQLVQEQVRDLANNEVTALHIYALNRVDLTADAIRAFQAEFTSESEPQFLSALAG